MELATDSGNGVAEVTTAEGIANSSRSGATASVLELDPTSGDAARVVDGTTT